MHHKNILISIIITTLYIAVVHNCIVVDKNFKQNGEVYSEFKES